MLFSSAIWLSVALMAIAQQIQPSNDTSDLSDPRTAPRFWINSTEVKQRDKFPGFLVAPLAQYSQISRNVFLSITFQGVLVNTNASNAAQVQSDDFNFVSCDPEDYANGAADVNMILNTITSQQASNTRDKSSLIFYSTRSNHCNATNISGLDLVNGIFTTLDPVVAAQVAALNFTEQSRIIALLSPDRSSYSPYGSNSGGYGTGPQTTAIAMIILYSITGIITAMFIVIIIVGAVRAHRHPERYGPRNMMGRPRQSRAKGIARAMLETIPIVKFGDHHDLVTGVKKSDTEMGTVTTTDASSSKDLADKNVATTTTAPVKALATGPENSETIAGVPNADGTDDAGSLGCSICTEDFQKGEEVRVLPCNHKFHPECVDPWLLNVSGTCPLCRISLATGEPEEAQGDGQNMPPPLDSASPSTDRRSQHMQSLMAIAYGSREERVAALRRYRAERRNRTINDEERISRARRFREAFRIRTRQHETNPAEQELRNTGIDAIAAPQTRM